jgi:hypothetical protein
MFSTLVDVFSVLLLEVDHGIVADLTDEGILMNGTLVEDKVVNCSVTGFCSFVGCERKTAIYGNILVILTF